MTDITTLNNGKNDTIRKSRRRSGGMPTIADVAAAAQCSPMTVSRVINGEAKVSDKTREAVTEAIKKLNYSPNRAAQSLAGGEQLKIALLYDNPSSSYLSELLMGVLEESGTTGVHLIVERCDVGNKGLDAVRRLADDGIGGFILPSPLCDEREILDLMDELNVVTFSVGPGNAPRSNQGAVLIDDYQAAYDMTEHIISLGHEKIGFILGNPQQVASGQRHNGYLDAMRDAGLPVPETLVAQGQFSYRYGMEAAEKLLSSAKNRPTAIFASNDDMAAATVAVAHRKQLEVPKDITVCGFDDTAIAQTIWPELTTIRQPIRKMAQHSMRVITSMMQDKINKGSSRKRQSVFDYELIRRESDAQVKK
jgi:LacI family transcriptional regulator